MFRLILWVIILLLVTFFVVFNVEPKVSVHLLPGFTLEGIPLSLVIIVSFLLGLLFGALIFFPQLIKAKMRINHLEKELKKIQSQAKEVTESAPDSPSS
ncbi:MAG: LapA family protein [Caldimicrobium sp.]